jgi:hypothetical protein
MKLIIASDLHGSFYYGKKLLDCFLREKGDTLILLGDIYYHGPRNPLEREYNPMALAELLNLHKDKLVVIKGNCDSEVDEMISQFAFLSTRTIDFGKFKITLTHGHLYDINNMPKDVGDIFLYGHTHIGFIEKRDKTIVANPGSVTLPKGGTERSYLTIDGDEIRLVGLESGNEIANLKM